MWMQVLVVVVDGSHLDPGKLPHTVLELEYLFWVGQLHDHRAYCLVEAGGNHLKSLIKSDVMIVVFQLLIQIIDELVLLLLGKVGLTEELV